MVEREQTPPQVSTLIHREVMEKMRPEFRDMFSSFIGTDLFIDFCKGQLECIEYDIGEVQKRMDLPAEQQFQLSKDMRLVWRFWTDLLRFAEEQKEANRVNNQQE